MADPRPARRRRVARRRPALHSWERAHNAFTVEGQIEDLSRFMGAMARARGWRRWVARGLGLLLLAMVLLSLFGGALGSGR